LLENPVLLQSAPLIYAGAAELDWTGCYRMRGMFRRTLIAQGVVGVMEDSARIVRRVNACFHKGRIDKRTGGKFNLS